jgi:hypothetical protein
MGDSWQPGRSQRGGEKKLCCVTTRGLNLGGLNGLRRVLRSLAPLSFGLGVPSSYVSIPAMRDLPADCLPAPYQPSALRILAIALVPAPRLILASTSFAQTRPQTRPAYSGCAVISCRTVAGAHGRCLLPREARGE